MDDNSGNNIITQPLPSELTNLNDSAIYTRKQLESFGINMAKVMNTTDSYKVSFKDGLMIFDENNNELAHIYNDGMTSYQATNCYVIYNRDGLLIKQVNSNGSYIDVNPNGGHTYYVDENTYTEFKPDGSKIYYVNGKITKQVNVDGNELYYNNGIISKMIIPDGTVVYYDSSGMVTKQVNSNGTYVDVNPDGSYTYYVDENTYTEYKTDGTKIYYTNGKIDRSIKPDGSQVYYTDENIYTEHKIDGTVILYKNGKITSKRNPDGSYSIYNDEGILCKEVKSDSSVIYYENGKVVKQMNTDGSYYFYDEDGIMYRHDKADGSYTYYVDENIYFEKDVYGTETHYENGKITKQVNADGSYSRYVYNNDGVIIKQENSDGSYFVYDDAGIMTEYHKADGSWTYYWFEDVYTDYLVDGSLIYYSFGKISKRVYPDGNSVNFKYFDDKEVAYSVDNSMLWEKYYDGGYNYYIDGNKWILSPDGTCEVKTNSDLKKYIYKINDDGSIEFTDLDTLERKVYNSSNELVMVRDANGNYINYENNSKVNYSSTNNKITVSNRNSIDFDEEKYNMIMRKLLSIYEGHSSIETYYNNVVSEVQKFPDYFSGLNTIGKMFEFYENIKGLKEKINYSSLAYKGYDEDLKDYLDNLVDEIFSLGQSNYETKFYDLVNENTGDLDNDGIIEYNENTNFKNFDRSMLENILVSKYGLELIYPDLILKKTLWINPDQDVIVSPVIKSINGIEFPCYYVFDLSNIDDPQKLIDNTEKCMQFTGEKYSNVDLLKSLKDKGYKFVFDDIPDIYGAAWCVASQELIKVHCCTDMWGEQYVVDALSHELGHAVDHSLIPDDNEKYYGNIIRSSYDNGNPMYLRINIPKTNDKYISIKYRSDGSAYCESLTGEVIEVNSNVINNNEVIVVDGYEYIIASKDEAINHSSEVFAETTRYNYIDKGVLLSRITASGRDRDDAYQLTTDCLTWYLSEYQNEDISWYINYLDEGDNNNER